MPLDANANRDDSTSIDSENGRDGDGILGYTDLQLKRVLVLGNRRRKMVPPLLTVLLLKAAEDKTVWEHAVVCKVLEHTNAAQQL